MVTHNAERGFHGDSHENATFAVEETPSSGTMMIENERYGDGEGGGDSDDKSLSVEMLFKGKVVPSWREQLTIRAFVVSFVLGVLLTFIVMKLNLTTGIIPSLNVSAGLLGFFFVKSWAKFMEKSGMLKQPFTRQENTVIQTCVVATSGIAFSGGFGSYLFGMSSIVAGGSEESNDAQNTKDPRLPWIIGFLFAVSFLGLFSVLPLRKIMVIDYKLTYPSGTATAHLINSFHTPQGAKLAKQQVRTLGKFFSFSFLWGFFQWFFTGGDGCGFSNFPTFGLEAYENRFYFDFSGTFVGVGMICPYLINVSVLVGAILSWGLMWPLIKKKGIVTYHCCLIIVLQVFLSIAMILGDGLYNFVKVLGLTIRGFIKQYKKMEVIPVTERGSPEKVSNSYDDEVRTKLFLKDGIPLWVSLVGYVAIAAVSIGVIPKIFHQMKWYYVLVIYIFAPVLAFCNAYGCGLTDWSLASTYGKLAIFAIGAWAGESHGGVLAGLAACGVMMNIVSTASDLMQDFKTGYMTLASPRSMFVSQVIGTAMGCIISPCVFWLFYKAFVDIGSPHSDYPAPNALVYRNMSVLGVEGFGSLPDHCLTLCYILFAGSIVINLIRDTVAKKWAKYIPLPMAMAIPFYLGPYFAIDMCVGSLILFIWGKLDKAKADAFGPAVASGLICGDGIWSLPSSILALAGVQPPICMKFLSRGTNARVDQFLSP
ncbi:hypothetical protein AAG906_031783 [Vitis piasezkii]